VFFFEQWKGVKMNLIYAAESIVKSKIDEHGFIMNTCIHDQSSENLDKFLKALEQNSNKLYFAKTLDKRHNIFGFWSLELLEKLEEDLTTNSIRKVEVWADKVGVKIINFKDENYDSFFNINTKEDLKKAEEMIKIIKND